MRKTLIICATALLAACAPTSNVARDTPLLPESKVIEAGLNDYIYVGDGRQTLEVARCHSDTEYVDIVKTQYKAASVFDQAKTGDVFGARYSWVQSRSNIYAKITVLSIENCIGTFKIEHYRKGD